ncbi:MAG: VOC family protein [Pyrinomonadaceae bacterium]
MKEFRSPIIWFEIPTRDIIRAREFYEAIFCIEMQPIPVKGLNMVAFPTGQTSEVPSGALIHNPYYEPEENGVLIYLNANPEIQNVINRIEPAGGEILVPKTLLTDELGYMALFMDTEGNRIGLRAKV